MPTNFSHLPFSSSKKTFISTYNQGFVSGAIVHKIKVLIYHLELVKSLLNAGLKVTFDYFQFLNC